MRSIIKTLLYRIVTICATFITAYVILQELQTPTILTILHEGIHTIIYYIFEKKIKSDDK